VLETEGVKDSIKDVYVAHSNLLCLWEIMLAGDGAGNLTSFTSEQCIVTSTVVVFMIIQVKLTFKK